MEPVLTLVCHVSEKQNRFLTKQKFVEMHLCVIYENGARKKRTRMQGQLIFNHIINQKNFATRFADLFL